jgi:transposase
MGRPSRFSPEVRERAVRMVFDHESSYDSQWAAIRMVADKIGCSSETLRNWGPPGGARSGATGGADL